MDAGIIETIAHYAAAKHISKEVSFILDIGGQDMKAIFVNDGVINRIEINEACSSGCGSFISTFAQSLDYSVEDFAKAACFSQAPCDLGTRCTVFMNSKVKQVLREGASVADIAAGLSYSVVKNCLYKVLQLKDTEILGDHIVVQGGTMRNDSIVRSLEKLTGKQTFRSNCPELMGALGCALYAKQIEKCPGDGAERDAPMGAIYFQATSMPGVRRTSAPLCDIRSTVKTITSPATGVRRYFPIKKAMRTKASIRMIKSWNYYSTGAQTFHNPYSP